jgi:hypothetical protein
MGQPTRDDAHLLVQLARLGAEMGVGESSGFIWSDAFVPDYAEFNEKHPLGSEGSRHVGTIATFYETVATLVKNDLISDDLIHDWLGSNLVWNRISGILKGQREDSGEPRLWENFESLATARAARSAAQ